MKDSHPYLSPSLAESGHYDNTTCKICGGQLLEILNLGRQPMANQYSEQPTPLVETYPLELTSCASCYTGQLSYAINKDLLFDNYHYETPQSDDLINHYNIMINRLKESNCIDQQKKVLEIGSNNGHLLKLLQPHVQSVLGIDPAHRIAQLAMAAGIPTIPEFFDSQLAHQLISQHGQFDLIIARHCFAHNRNIQEILQGISHALSNDGLLIIENSYWPNVIGQSLFDQVYHEHIFYHTLTGIQKLVKSFNLQLSEAFPVNIQGGSMVFIINREGFKNANSNKIQSLILKEKSILTSENYNLFKNNVEEKIFKLKETISELRNSGKTIYGYGASAKASTLLNAANIDHADIPFIVDSTQYKQLKYLPKSNIQIISEAQALRKEPDFYVLFIWNYADQIIEKIKSTHTKLPQLIIPHPEFKIIQIA